jgi:hypothetical protein
MKALTLIVALLVLTACGTFDPSGSDAGEKSAGQSLVLERYRNNSRPLVIFAPRDTDTRLQQQLAIAASAGGGFAERKIVVIAAVEEGQSTAAGGGITINDVHMLRNRLHISDPSRFRVLLVGLDGQVKLSSDEPVQADELFKLIDDMPARLFERFGWGGWGQGHGAKGAVRRFAVHLRVAPQRSCAISLTPRAIAHTFKRPPRMAR